MAHLDRVLASAIKAAHAAGRIAMRAWGGKLKIETKADLTPVTAIDRACEEAIRASLHRDFPGDGLLGEEFGGESGSGGARWIVDPIDGTKNFIRGGPFWGVLIAREEAGRLVAGVCWLPALNQLSWAARGRGAFLNRKRLRVRTAPLAKSYVIHSPLGDFVRTKTLKRLARIATRCSVAGCLGESSPFLWVAQGHAQAMIEADIKPWDVAAPRIIVEEAGGRSTVWRGSWGNTKGLGLLASCRRTHGPLLRALQGR